MALVEKNVTTIEELKTLVNHGNKAAVLYDASTGEAYGLDLEVLIAMDSSINDKVDKATGKSLIADTEIARLAGVTNQTLEGIGGEATANKQNSLATDGSGAKFPTVDAVNLGLATKPAKTLQVVAGLGLTGGGTLESDRELNVVSANDGITVNADNIQLNVVDGLTSTSTTQPLSANMGKALNDGKEDKANKKTTLTDSDTDYPTTKATATALFTKLDKSAVKATTGTSENDVMSQKAVTDELELKAGVEVVAKNTSDIRTLENTLNSANLNQETTAQASGVDIVTLPKTAANTGMQVKLEGQSAENLVVNGDFRDGTTGWISYECAFAVQNNTLTLTHNASDRSFAALKYISEPIVGSSKYYIKARARVTNSVCQSIVLSLNDGTSNDAIISTPSENVWYSLSEVLTTSAVPTNNRIDVGNTYPDAATAAGKVMEVQDVMCVNLTTTFGAGNEPTVEQCDALFANYFEGSDNVLGTGRVRSVGKNIFDNRRIPLEGLAINDTIYNVDDRLCYKLSGWIGSEASNLFVIRDKFVKNTAYTLSAFLKPTVSQFYMRFYYTDGTYSESFLANISPFTNISVTSNPAKEIDFIVIGPGSAGWQGYIDINSIQLEISTTATAYEPYRESVLQLTTPELRSNGVIKDEIRKGTNGYELVKRVGVGTLGSNIVVNGTFETADSWVFDTGWAFDSVNKLAVATNANSAVYQIGNPTEASKPYRISYTISGYSAGRVVLRCRNSISVSRNTNGTFTEFFVAGTSSDPNIYMLGLDGFSGSIDNIVVEPVNELEGASTGSTFTEFGSNVHYTLATPVVSPIPHAGLLNSNSNGTTYFEPIIADAGVYSTNIAIQLTDYPIATFETIRKYANGTYTELDTATAVIASGGLSFTHPDLVSGDLVMFTYEYDLESIGRSMTLTHYDSRYYPKYDDEYPSGQWVDAAAAAAPSETNVTIAGVATRKQSFATGDAKSNMFEIRHGSAIDFINSGEMPIEFHIHAMPSTNNAGTAIFTFNWCYSPPNAAPIACTAVDLTFTISANRQYWHLLAGALLTPPTGGFAIGGKIEFTVTRKVAGNTYPDAIFFDKCALHRPINSMGTKNLYSN